MRFLSAATGASGREPDDEVIEDDEVAKPEPEARSKVGNFEIKKLKSVFYLYFLLKVDEKLH